MNILDLRFQPGIPEFERTLTVIFSPPNCPPIVILSKFSTAISASCRVSYRTNATPRERPVSLHVKMRQEIIFPKRPKRLRTSTVVQARGRPATYRFVFYKKLLNFDVNNPSGRFLRIAETLCSDSHAASATQSFCHSNKFDPNCSQYQNLL